MSPASTTTPLDPSGIAARVRSLPSLPSAVLRLLDVLQDPLSDIDTVTELVSTDQALVAQVLRLANSPFYGLSGRVASIRDGINILGLGQIRSLVLTAVMTIQFDRLHGRALHMQAFWRHSLACAVASAVLARATGLNEGAAFTAGLLHDMGRLVLDSLYPETMAAVLEQAQAHDLPSHLVEVQHFGVSHTQVGGWLAEQWHFDQGVCDAIAQHHEPQPSSQLGLVDLVHLADAVAHALDVAGDPHEAVPNIRTSAWTKLNLATDLVPVLLERIETGFQQLQEALTPPGDHHP